MSRAGSALAFRELRQHVRDDAVAARPGKGERVAVGEVDLLREGLAKQAPGAEKARAHRGLWDGERRRGLLDGELFQRAQHEHDAKRIGQFVDLRLEQPARLRTQRRVLGLFGCGFVHVRLCDFTVGFRIAIQPYHFGAASALAQPRDGLVHHDAHEPGRKPRIAPETADRAIGEEIRLLHRVLGLGVVLEDAARHAVEPLVVAPHQERKSLGSSRPKRSDRQPPFFGRESERPTPYVYTIFPPSQPPTASRTNPDAESSSTAMRRQPSGAAGPALITSATAYTQTAHNITSICCVAVAAAGCASSIVMNSMSPVAAAGSAITSPAARHQKPACHQVAAPVHAASASHTSETDQSATGKWTTAGCSG